MEQEFSCLDRVMETGYHFKNGVSPQSQKNRRHFLVCCMILLAFVKVAAQSIKLDKTQLELIPGEEQKLFATTTPVGQSVTWTSSDVSKVSVEGSYGEAKVIAKTAGTATIHATFRGQTVSCALTVYDVFSGDGVTIDGVTWATRNVGIPGSFASKGSDSGMFYQWNRKIGWSSTEPPTSSPPNHSWDNSVPSGTSWTADNNPCPAGWGVPTYEEMEKLINAGYFWTTVNGKIGMKFGKDKTVIFLPAAGYFGTTAFTDGTFRGGSYLKDEDGKTGSYWTDTERGNHYAYDLRFYDVRNILKGIFVGVRPNSARVSALSVRCVKKPQDLTYTVTEPHTASPPVNNNNSQPNSVSMSSHEYLAEGYEYANKGDYSIAIEFFKKALEIDPNNKDAYYGVGYAYELLNNYPQAIAYYNKVLEIDPNHVNSNFSIGRIYFNQGVIQLDNANNFADVNRYNEEKNKANDLFRKALPYLERAHTEMPEQPDIMHALSYVYSNLGMNEEFENIKAKMN